MPLLLGVLAVIAALALGKKGTTMTNTFRQDFLSHAKNVDWQGIDPLYALAQADLESGTGTGNVFKNTKNLFSITKGSTWKGITYKSASGLEFRVYPTWEESMKDWVRLMHLPLYAQALGYALSKNFRAFAYELKRVGYDASSTTYAQDLVARYDQIKTAVV